MNEDAPTRAQRIFDYAAALQETHGEHAIAAAKVGLQTSSKPEDIEFWAGVCAVLATRRKMS